jgi:hypothetical protein
MSIRKIKINNSDAFLKDIKRVSECMVIAPKSNVYLPVPKSRLLKEAENEKIRYYGCRR